MFNDDQFYADFLNEARDLLQVIEQELLSLRQAPSPAKVHNLMRAAHTLKGASASMGLNALSQIAHGLEGIFKSLYHPDLEIDGELETLLFQAYEALQIVATRAIANSSESDLEEDLNQAAGVLAQLQAKLGDFFNPEAAIPSSAELGFDMVQSIFEVGVNQRLGELEEAIAEDDPLAVVQILQTCIEVFEGLAESLDLPGFGEIVRAVEAAIVQHPEDILAIAPLALADFRQGQEAVLGGDRTSGGQPSLALVAFSQGENLPMAEEEFRSSSFEEVEATLLLDEEDDQAMDFQEDETILLYPQVAPEVLPAEQPESNLELELESESEELLADETTANAEDADQLNSTDSSPLSLEQVFGTVDPTMLDDFTAEEDLASLEIEPSPVAMEEPLEEEEKAEAPPQPVLAPRPQSVRVDLEQLERLNFQAGELLINQNKQAAQSEQLLAAMQEMRSRLQKHQDTLDRLRAWGVQAAEGGMSHPTPIAVGRAPRSRPLIPQLDSLELDRYNDLHLLLQDAGEDRVRMEETADLFELLARQASQTIEKQQRLLAGVRDEVTQARMQQFGEILGRMERLVQQLIASYEKPVKFEISGDGVPIDKAIAQQLYDPLLHLVRNAFAHGIEPPEVRRELGKEEVGTIGIRAYNQGNRTLLEVSDNGQGIDFAKIRDRAVELKLVSPSKASTLSESELLDFIFQPGFSTAREANDLYGRGVGLDVVRANLEAIEANVAVASQPQVGTTFTIRLPLTLSIAKLLVCQADGLAYALPSDCVEQIVLLQRDRVRQIGQQRVWQWQHNLLPGNPSDSYTVPLYRLCDLLTYHSPLAVPPLESPAAPLPMVMLLQAPSGLIGLEVDRVIGEQELVIRPLGRALSPPRYVDGCSILSSSRLALVIDAIALVEATLAPDSDSPSSFSTSDVPQLAPERSQPQLPPTPTQTTVLVVDDSITLRQNVTRTLQKAGYQVLQAQDGVEAIAQLQQHSTISAIVCDLEMPRMNGFEFLHTYRQDPQLRNIATIILTSRQGDKHRHIALELGAADYLTKPYLERDLLQAIAQQMEKDY